MFEKLYIGFYIVSLASLIGWFFFEGNKKLTRKLSLSFLVFFFGYLVAVWLKPGLLVGKLPILARDLFVMGVVAYGFNFLKGNKLAIIGALIVLASFFRFFYGNVMINSFEASTEVETSMAFEDGELLVELSENTSSNVLNKLVDRFDLKLTESFDPESERITDLDDYWTIDISDKHEDQIEKIIELLEMHSHVESVELNERVEIDPLEQTIDIQKINPSKYKVNDPSVTEQWAMEALQMDKLYEVLASNKPKEKASIFILDTGVDAKHEDLAANYKSYKSSEDTDQQGHGTHCAGIAAAVTNNKLGIASMARDNNWVSVSSIKVLNRFGMGNQVKIIQGIIKAADAGADVISMSLGGKSVDSQQKAYNKAFKYAQKKGAIVVVAAGNSNKNAKNFSPANCDGVITVSAIDGSLERAKFSNTVESLKMGVAAPGVDIYSTLPNNTYKSQNGTSMATPFVSGLIGLMKSINPKLTTKEVFKILDKTGKKTKDSRKTGKLIVPFKAIEEVLK